MEVYMKEISDFELNKYGIHTKHHIMDNGELRFRLIGADGSAYVRTESSLDSGWQNSHYHKTIKELYLVQKGCILFAELLDDKMVIKKYISDEYCISQPRIPHNVYMAPNTILHTIKYGDCTKPDWEKSKTLDELLKKIDIANLEL